MSDAIANKFNPFKQSKATWQISLVTSFEDVDYYADWLEPLSCSLSYFELEAETLSFESRPKDLWQINAYFSYQPDCTDLQQELELLADNYNIEAPQLSLIPVLDIDWITVIDQKFVPFTVGRYFIYNSVKTKLPHSLYPLRIPASRAFGTGEHETTSSCLLALTELAKARRFKNMLDMGCGTAILAIAMAHSWKKKIMAVDIDTQAVMVANANAKQNRVANLIHTHVGNGYLSKTVRRNAPYDLIVANILAKPLKKFAPLAEKNLARGGVLVLSGLLATQERMVLAAHMTQGLYLKKRIKRNGWNSLILWKK